MPYRKLIEMEKFSKLRVKQLWDDARIESAHYSSIKKGISIIQAGKRKTLLNCIKRYARVRGLLMALGYSLGVAKKKTKTTLEFKEMFKLAIPSIKYYYQKYKGKVRKA